MSVISFVMKLTYFLLLVFALTVGSLSERAGGQPAVQGTAVGGGSAAAAGSLEQGIGFSPFPARRDAVVWCQRALERFHHQGSTKTPEQGDL